MIQISLHKGNKAGVAVFAQPLPDQRAIEAGNVDVLINIERIQAAVEMKIERIEKRFFRRSVLYSLLFPKTKKKGFRYTHVFYR